MGRFTIILEDEHEKWQEILSPEFSIPDSEIFQSDKYKLLKYLDPFGNTIFNHLQMDNLVEDLEILKPIFNQAEVIDAIIELANKCQEGVHMYLTFSGD